MPGAGRVRGARRLQNESSPRAHRSSAGSMNVLHVVHGFPPETSGGTERTVEALARAMQRLGCTVTVAAGSLRLGNPGEPTREDHDGLPVLRLHRDDLWFESWFKTFSPPLSEGFARLLARLQPDVVHVHHWLRLT